MYKFKDFRIETYEEQTFMKDASFEDTEQVLLRINSWVEENELVLLNIETLLIPNMFHRSNERTSTKGFFATNPSSQKVTWYQVFRVWYQ